MKTIILILTFAIVCPLFANDKCNVRETRAFLRHNAQALRQARNTISSLITRATRRNITSSDVEMLKNVLDYEFKKIDEILTLNRLLLRNAESCN